MGDNKEASSTLLPCFVVGPTSCVEELFVMLGLKGASFSYNPNSTVHNKMNLQTAITGKSFPAPANTAEVERPSKEVVFCFHRCNDSDGLLSGIDDTNDMRVILVMYSAEQKDFCLSSLNSALEDLASLAQPSSTLFLVDCTKSGVLLTLQEKIMHTLCCIHMAFSFCAYKMLKWSPEVGSLDTLLSFISDPPVNLRSTLVCQNLSDPHILPSSMQQNSLPLESELVPLLEIPTTLDISCADVPTAHMIMQLVHNYQRHFPFFTVTMALRTWLTANNEAAVGVVCLAGSLTESRNINLSGLKLKSVPKSLRTLACRTLNLSGNNIQKIPKWLAETPHVGLGSVKQRGSYFKARTDMHKLVIVGDTGVGKTTLLRCMMEGKKKLNTKHVHTGIAVHHDVRFKQNPTTSWTIWDLGGDSLTPFHRWFLLSQAIFLVVFDVSKALMMKEPHMAVYQWLNEISVARSRGANVRRSIIPVGTHMEGIDPNSSGVSHLIDQICRFEDVPCAFFLQLHKGKGVVYEKRMLQQEADPGCISFLVNRLQQEICDDGIPKSVPQRWLMLNNKLIQIRDKAPTGRNYGKVSSSSSLSWVWFGELARRCGVSDIEQCANFLADIGTIVHFRYPFWAGFTGYHDLIILEPRSFLITLIEEYHKLRVLGTDDASVYWKSSTGMVMKFLTEEYPRIDIIFSHSPSPVKDSVSLFPLTNKFVPSSSPPTEPKNSVTSSGGESSVTPGRKRDPFSGLDSSLSVPTSMISNGRLIKFPLYPQEAIFKAISSIGALSSSQFLCYFTLQYCSRDGILFASTTQKEGRQPQTEVVFVTFKDATASIYMRREGKCKDQERFWASLLSILHRVTRQLYDRFGEGGVAEQQQAADLPAVVELFACPHCLLEGYSSLHSWFRPDKPTALPPNTFYFSRDDILKAVKTGAPKLRCGGKGNHEFDLAALAFNKIHEEVITPVNKKPDPPTAIPPEFRAVIGMEISSRGITLGELLSLLLEKGNGTTSVLDQVLPISLRLKILRNVADDITHLGHFTVCTLSPGIPWLSFV
ncbi:hypothetical protein Pelo_17407 [Pelomyxa schiedti]|nr:hypothetical protein Pelo_17407 [Pelomyxa schiedti]